MNWRLPSTTVYLRFYSKRICFTRLAQIVFWKIHTWYRSTIYNSLEYLKETNKITWIDKLFGNWQRNWTEYHRFCSLLCFSFSFRFFSFRAVCYQISLLCIGPLHSLNHNFIHLKNNQLKTREKKNQFVDDIKIQSHNRKVNKVHFSHSIYFLYVIFRNGVLNLNNSFFSATYNHCDIKHMFIE